MVSEAAAGRARDQCRWPLAPLQPPSLVRPPILPRAYGVASVTYEPTERVLQSGTILRRPRSEVVGLRCGQELSEHPAVLMFVAGTSTRSPRSHSHTATPEGPAPQGGASASRVDGRRSRPAS